MRRSNFYCLQSNNVMFEYVRTKRGLECYSVNGEFGESILSDYCMSTQSQFILTPRQLLSGLATLIRRISNLLALITISYATTGTMGWYSRLFPALALPIMNQSRNSRQLGYEDPRYASLYPHWLTPRSVASLQVQAMMNGFQNFKIDSLTFFVIKSKDP